MQKHILVLTTSAFILACGAIAAGAQQTPGGPTMQQPDQQPTMQQIQERVRQIEEALVRRRVVEDYDDDGDDNRHGRGGYGAGWRHHQGWVVKAGIEETGAEETGAVKAGAEAARTEEAPA